MARAEPLLFGTPRPQDTHKQALASLWPIVITVTAVHLLSLGTFALPDPALIFTIPVTLAAVRGGWGLGLLAATIAVADLGLSLFAAGADGGPIGQGTLARIAVAAFCLPALVLILGRFRNRIYQEGDFQASELEAAGKDGGHQQSLSDSTSRSEVECSQPTLVALFENATSREQSEEPSLFSEPNFHQMAETIGEVFWITSPDGNTVHYVNPAFEKIWGRSCAELYANPKLWMEAIHPEDAAKVRNAFESLPQGGTFNVDYRIARPDGTLVWISDRGYVERDDRGRVVRLSGVATDITWRKQAERALSDREAQYRAVIETTPDGFYVLDHRGRFLEVNDAFLRYSGYTLDELRGMHVADIDVIETWEEAERHGIRIRQKGSDTFETVQRTRDGGLLPVEVNVSYWSGDGGKYFVFVRDITQRNMVQSALRKWADAFENCAHGIALGDPVTGRVVACNPAFARLQGRSTEEVAGSEILAPYEPSDRALVLAKIQEADQFGHAAL